MEKKQYSFFEEVIGCIPFLLIMFYNTLTLGQAVNAAIIVPEVLYVLYYLIKGRADKALFWHIVFVLCCISSEAVDGSDIASIYSYSRLKIAGPLNVCDIMILLILACSLSKNNRKINLPVYTCVYKSFIFLLISAFILGIVGVAFSDYQLRDTLNRVIYLAIVIIYMACIKLNNTYDFECLVRDNIYRLLWSVSVVSSVCFLALGINISHSGVEGLSVGPDIAFFSIIIIFAFFSRNKLWVLIALLCKLPMLFMGLSGKALIVTFGSVICFAYVARKNKMRMSLSSKALLLFCACGLVFLGIKIFNSIEINQYAIVKMGEFLSLFNGYSNMGESSQIRVSSFYNIIYCSLFSPIKLFFGQGYGGYFTDALNLFKGVSIDAGWPAEVIARGKFTSAHDTFASVALYHGLVGLYLIYGSCIKYLKMMVLSPYAYSAFIFLGLVFYSNFHYAVAGVLFLYITEIEYNKQVTKTNH